MAEAEPRADASESARGTRLGLPSPRRPDGARSVGAATRILAGAETRRGAEIVRLGPGVHVPGTQYRITGWLGDGAMGVVYEAEHVELERTVALKILRPEACGSPMLAEMFRKEAKNASRIGSKFIVEVYDLGSLEDGRVWFTMPLLRGASLRDAVEKHGAIEPGRAIAILRQVCKALAAAHRERIIHRDVKPENIMLTREGGRDDAVRVLDWGIAALQGDAEGGTDVAAGTPYYIAPEVVSGLPYDHRSDIYSVGCTAYEMLCGRPPFDSPNLGEILVAHVEHKPPPLSSIATQPIAPALCAVVERCLAKSPDARYADAEQLEAALCEAQIEADYNTAWDDLPLPDIDPQRRAELAAKMPDVAFERRGRVWIAPALGGALVALVAAALVGSLSDDHADAPVFEELDTFVNDAHAAAAKSFFVYPPADDPNARTAYHVVLALERLEGDAAQAARARAAELREEFAHTLLRLGDHYWERDGGRAFAIDYYAEALVFDPGLSQARARASLTPGELAELRDKASSAQWSEQELLAVQPLIVLAKDDPDQVARELEELQDNDAVSVSTAARLSRLIRTEPGKSKPSRAAPAIDTAKIGLEVAGDQAHGDESVSAEAAGSVFAEAAGSVAASEVSASPDVPAARKRDPAEAQAAIAKAESAFRSGDLGAAEKHYQTAIAADDRSSAAYDGLGRLAFHRGSYAQAVRHGERAVRIAPKNGKYRLNLGDAYYKAFRYEDAAREYGQAEKLGQDGAAARRTKAEAKIAG